MAGARADGRVHQHVLVARARGPRPQQHVAAPARADRLVHRQSAVQGLEHDAAVRRRPQAAEGRIGHRGQGQVAVQIIHRHRHGAHRERIGFAQEQAAARLGRQHVHHEVQRVGARAHAGPRLDSQLRRGDVRRRSVQIADRPAGHEADPARARDQAGRVEAGQVQVAARRVTQVAARRRAQHARAHRDRTAHRPGEDVPARGRAGHRGRDRLVLEQRAGRLHQHVAVHRRHARARRGDREIARRREQRDAPVHGAQSRHRHRGGRVDHDVPVGRAGDREPVRRRPQPHAARRRGHHLAARHHRDARRGDRTLERR